MPDSARGCEGDVLGVIAVTVVVGAAACWPGGMVVAIVVTIGAAGVLRSGGGGRPDTAGVATVTVTAREEMAAAQARATG